MAALPEDAPRIGLPCSTMDETSGQGVRRQHVPTPYVERVVEAGGLPLLLPVASPDRADAYLSLVDGLLLIGGDDVDPALYGSGRPDLCQGVDRERDEFEIALARRAVETGMPVFGICRGLQLLNVALGGTLVEDIPSLVEASTGHRLGFLGPTHEVEIAAGSRLRDVLGAPRVAVNSAHHQSVKMPAPGLAVTARGDDGVVEGAEAPGRAFCLAVQWHPERMNGADSTRRLFGAFLQAARERVAAGRRSRR